MEIKRINSSNTSPIIDENEIIEIHYKLIKTYSINLKTYGVKPLWNELYQDIQITPRDIKNLSNKELQMIFLYKYMNCFVHKDLISKFVRLHKPNEALDQQVRHLGSQDGWYVLNKNTKVPNTNEKVPTGYHYLLSIEIPNPKVVKEAMRRMGRNSAKTFQELIYAYDNKCATCGLEEGKKDWRTGKNVKLQQGHMNPRKELTLDNTIPQCEYCNQSYKDYFVFDDKGRVMSVNNPEILLRSPEDIQNEMVELLLKEQGKQNK